MNLHFLRRRSLLCAAGTATAVALLPAVASVALLPAAAVAAGPAPKAATGPAIRMTQLMDMSASQQALSRDYATGFRLAFAEAKAASGLNVELQSVELDGSDAALRDAVQSIKADAAQVALVGAVGERMALASLQQAAQAELDIAHVAPWLADTRFDAGDNLFALFASREEQIRYVLKGLASMGVADIGIVYPNAAHEAALQPGTAQVLERLKLRARVLTVPAKMNAEGFGAQLDAKAPYFLLFMGDAVELALFTRGLAQRKIQRTVLCLSDVDTNTFLQLVPGKAVPVIFTRLVPDPRAGKVAVVRAYQGALQRYFDEEPSATSLAGYLGGRYAASVIGAAGASPTRARVLAEFKRRNAIELDGWRFDFAANRRASAYVGQVLWNGNGSFVG